MRALKYLMLIGFLLPGNMLWAQTLTDPIQQAREAYDRGDYPGAISVYQKLVAGGAQSAELFYNLVRLAYHTLYYRYILSY